VQLDDDYTAFDFRIDTKGQKIVVIKNKKLNEFVICSKFYKNTSALSIALHKEVILLEG
jgi:hypothetical protein